MQQHLRDIRTKDFIMVSVPGNILWWVVYTAAVAVKMGATPGDLVAMVVSLCQEVNLLGACLIGLLVLGVYWGIFALAQLVFLWVVSCLSFSSRRVGEAFYVIGFGFAVVCLSLLLSGGGGAALSWPRVLLGWMLYSGLALCTLLCLHGLEWYRRR